MKKTKPENLESLNRSQEFTEEKMIEQVVDEWYGEKEEKPQESLTEQERAIRRDIKEKLIEELRKMDQSPDLREQALKKAKKIQALDVDRKINQLLELAEKRGLAFAIYVAKKGEDEHAIDALHDILAKNERYKNYLK